MKNEKKYPWQQCQSEDLNEKFSKLHRELVDKIIQFCKENDVDFDNVYLSADGLRFSIPYGEWTAATDSAMSAYRWTKENPYHQNLSECKPFLQNL